MMTRYNSKYDGRLWLAKNLCHLEVSGFSLRPWKACALTYIMAFDRVNQSDLLFPEFRRLTPLFPEFRRLAPLLAEFYLKYLVIMYVLTEARRKAYSPSLITAYRCAMNHILYVTTYTSFHTLVAHAQDFKSSSSNFNCLTSTYARHNITHVQKDNNAAARCPCPVPLNFSSIKVLPDPRIARDPRSCSPHQILLATLNGLSWTVATDVCIAHVVH